MISKAKQVNEIKLNKKAALFCRHGIVYTPTQIVDKDEASASERKTKREKKGGGQLPWTMGGGGDYSNDSVVFFNYYYS